MPGKERGFSLIELLIVVAIILIITAIAIPNLLRSRMASNEASAVGSIRTMNTASITYNSTYGNGFPPSLTAIGKTGQTPSCTNAMLLGWQTGSVQVNSSSSSCSGGYGYSDGYVVVAHPITTGTTGNRSFCSDASGVIRFDPTGAMATRSCARFNVASKATTSKSRS